MQKSSIFLLAIIGLLVLILMVERCGDKPEPINENVYNTYTTDTTHFNRAYRTLLEEVKGLEERLEETPPTEVRYYTTPNPEMVTIEKIPDSILVYIGELEERLEIAISDKYIKNYPNADKLVDFQLTRDLFDITTLTIAGETKESRTPLYLDQYNYYWDNNTLYHERREKPYTPPNQNVWNQLYIEPGYDLLHQAPRLGLEYDVKMGRFKISTETYTLFHTNGTQLYGNAKLGYRLLK